VPGPSCHFLARHHLQGSRPKLGVPFLVPAVDHLRKAYRDEEALDLLERAVAAPGLLAGKDRIRALLRAGPLRRERGRPGDGTAGLEEAVALAGADGEAGASAEGRGQLASHLLSLGQFVRALEVAEAGLPLALQAGDAAAGRGLLMTAGLSCWRLGRMEDARERFEKVLGLARGAADVGAEARAMGNLGNTHADLGRHAESRTFHERAVELCRRAGDRRSQAIGATSLGENDRADGRYASACERYRESELLSRETGSRVTEGVARHDLGETFAVVGDVERSGELLQSASALAAEVGARWLVGYGRRALGDLASLAGDAARAAALYDEALSIGREVKSAALEAEALVGLGRLHAQAGRTETAATRLDEALDVARRIDESNTLALATAIRAALPGGDAVAAAKTLDDLGTRPWHVARMEARWWLWKATNDRAHLMESWRLLRHLRDHAPEENRVTVIANVPLHRDIAAAAKAAGL